MGVAAQVAIIVLGVLAVLWTLALVPAFMELRQMARRLQDFLTVLEVEMRPGLEELREALRNLNKASQGVTTGMVRIGNTLEALGETGETIRTFNAIFRALLSPRLVALASAAVGIRAGIGLILKRLLGRR